MKDYSLNDEDRKDYIMEYYYVNKDDCLVKDHGKELEVKFADCQNGRNIRFSRIDASDKNIEKLDKKMEEQMYNAINNRDKYVLNRKKSSAICYGLSVVAGSLAAFLSTVEDNPLIYTAIGGVYVVSIIPFMIKKKKANDRIREIDKAEYIRTFKNELDSISKYPNSLSGVSKDFMDSFCYKTGKNKFKINNLDLFKQKDLEIIVDNIRREEKFNFDYPSMVKVK